MNPEHAANSRRVDTMHTAPAETWHVVTDVLGVPFHVLLTPEDGVLRAAGFATATDPHAETLFARVRERDPVLAARPRRTLDNADSAVVAHIVAMLKRYDTGDLNAIDTLATAQRETPFRGEVWRALREITPGSPVSYTELAQLAGRDTAVRAAASACANNLVALIVPCHRVVRTDGQPGGYLFGTALKARILAHEAAHAPAIAQSRAAT